MKIRNLLGASALFVLFGMMVAACGDDNSAENGGGRKDPIETSPYRGPEKVFGTTLINLRGTEEGDVTATYFRDYNRLTPYFNGTMGYWDTAFPMTLDDKSIVFSFKQQTEDVMRMELALNSDGFATRAMWKERSSQEVENVVFGYNNDGQLNFINWEDYEIYHLTYVNGDITRVDATYPATGDEVSWDISYGETPIENKGGVMEFNEAFGLDIDEFLVAYYAGLLGRPTHHLPVLGHGKWGVDVLLNWTLDSNGLPVKVRIEERGTNASSQFEEITYGWETITK
ncbi:MAG: DUF4595 domain-containing protein [Bacteroidaceae bacterium]|nr:DUF4595 domain-containing protein [Bacteroidaceae bacterium]